MIVVSCIFIGVAIVIFAFDNLVILSDANLRHLYDDVALASSIVAIFPPAILYYMNQLWRRSFDAAVPELLRDIVQAEVTGLSVIRAIEEVSKRDYGPLTTELRRAIARMTWGVPFDEAMRTFAKEGGTPLVQRAVSLIIEASKAGGEIRRVLELTMNYIRDTHMMERERATMVRPYIIVSYVAFFIFLAVAVMLQLAFFVPLEDVMVAGGAVAPVLLSSKESAVFFFRMAMIQGFFCGLIAGKMGEGSVFAGLKHSLILMSIGYVVLVLTLGT